MSSRRLWIIFGIIFLIVGGMVLEVLWRDQRTVVAPLLNDSADSSAPVVDFDPTIIPGSEPDYTPANQPPSPPTPEPSPSDSVPVTPKINSVLQSVSYRGLITRVGDDFIEFIPLGDSGERRVRAPVNAETKIWRHEFIPAAENTEAKKTAIVLEDLSLNDDVIVNGWAKEYFMPLVKTTEIIKLTP